MSHPIHSPDHLGDGMVGVAAIQSHPLARALPLLPLTRPCRLWGTFRLLGVWVSRSRTLSSSLWRSMSWISFVVMSPSTGSGSSVFPSTVKVCPVDARQVKDDRNESDARVDLGRLRPDDDVIVGAGEDGRRRRP